MKIAHSFAIATKFREASNDEIRIAKETLEQREMLRSNNSIVLMSDEDLKRLVKSRQVPLIRGGAASMTVDGPKTESLLQT
jgi:rRNA-processing protein FCF1